MQKGAMQNPDLSGFRIAVTESDRKPRSHSKPSKMEQLTLLYKGG